MSSALSATPQEPARVLIIRFSSFGDILQATPSIRALKKALPGVSIDWLARADFASVLRHDPDLASVIPFARAQGLLGLVRLAWILGGAGYTHVYDAHNNLRSRFACALIQLRRGLRWLLSGAPRPLLVRRPKHRLRRWLLFRWRIRALPTPFRGAVSYLVPLQKWGVLSWPLPTGPHVFPGPLSAEERCGLPEGKGSLIALAPSAAWEMKRWPPEHWRRLIELMPTRKFVLLGGPEDSFCESIRAVAPERVLNLAGKLDLEGSMRTAAQAELTISADTGLLHAADLMGKPTIALIGPTAFGYPSGPRSEFIELSLWCKPCSKDGRGRCRNETYKRCLVELRPEAVAAAAERALFRADRARTKE